MCECDRTGYEFDANRRECVDTHTSSSYLPPLPAAHPGELRECYYNLAEQGTCSLLAANSTQQECCCTVGEGWGLGCQYHTCPSYDSGEAMHQLNTHTPKFNIQPSEHLSESVISLQLTSCPCVPVGEDM